jgi:hypothetical protein
MKKGLLIAVIVSVAGFCSLSFAEAQFVKVAGTMSSTMSSTDTNSDGSTAGTTAASN